MTLANYNANQLWLLLVKNQHKLNLLVVTLLAIFLLSFLAELTWRLVPEPNTNNQQLTSKNSSQVVSTNNNRLNLAEIKKLELFGNLTAKPIQTQVVTDAPVTRLNLTLTGVVTSSDEEQGAAIIENRNQQQTYGIGEKIEGTNATLLEVQVDRVIIKNGVQQETLMLDGVDYIKNQNQNLAQSKAPPRQPEVSDQRRTLSPDAIQATRELQKKPANFTEFMAIFPHRPNGELQGYRVMPGKDPSIFNAAGLVRGDIITELNGLDLTDMQQSLEAMNMLKQLQSLQMTVMRKDEFMTIYLDLPEGEEEF